MAREVQLRLLPPSAPQPKRAEIATAFLPARLIGGDVYDFIDYSVGKSSSRKRVAIMLGDVSGKAAPAALYAALVSGILRSLAARQLPPDELLAELNNQLQERRLDSQYVTMLISVWNDESRTLQVSNAGSVQPIHVSFASSGHTEVRKKSNDLKVLESGSEPDLQVTTILAEGFPLGLFPDAQYDLLTVQTKPSDLIVFFSDGIVDAENADGEMFGTDRLRLVLRDNPQACQSAQATVDAILAAVDSFQAGTAHFDDETLVVIRVL